MELPVCDLVRVLSSRPRLQRSADLDQLRVGVAISLDFLADSGLNSELVREEIVELLLVRAVLLIDLASDLLDDAEGIVILKLQKVVLLARPRDAKPELLASISLFGKQSGLLFDLLLVVLQTQGDVLT